MSGSEFTTRDVKDGELPMWVADMDFECAPEIKKALSARVSHGIFGYTDTNDDWRNAYVNFWKRRHSFNMEEVISFPSDVFI